MDFRATFHTGRVHRIFPPQIIDASPTLLFSPAACFLDRINSSAQFENLGHLTMSVGHC